MSSARRPPWYSADRVRWSRFKVLGVEGEPAAVGSEDPVRDHDMGVQLRVERPADVLAKRHRHDPLRVDDVDLRRCTR